jgi:D-aminopeptidase
MAQTGEMQSGRRGRARELGIQIGVMPPGALNALTDVAGVRVGHATLHRGDSIRTGVTAIIPADENLYQNKLPAGVDVGNGFGKLAGATQIDELGELETPILLTNTLSVGVCIDALIDDALAQPGNEQVKSVNAVVGETNDGVLNDIRGRHVRKEDALAALRSASRQVAEGCVGGGTGTICFGFKGGIGTASRQVTIGDIDYTVGALVQSNFGGVLRINGLAVGEMIGKTRMDGADVDGSCMIVLATDAPLDARNLKRLARRGIFGMARTGGIASNGSGDYAIAFSTDPSLRIEHHPRQSLRTVRLLHNEFLSPLFQAAIEATEEAIVNSLFMSETTTGAGGTRVEALPLDKLLSLLHPRKQGA